MMKNQLPDHPLFKPSEEEAPEMEAGPGKVILKLDPWEHQIGSIILADARLPDTGTIVSVSDKCKDIKKEHEGMRAQALPKLGTHLRIKGHSYLFLEEKQIAGLCS